MRTIILINTPDSRVDDFTCVSVRIGLCSIDGGLEGRSVEERTSRVVSLCPSDHGVSVGLLPFRYAILKYLTPSGQVFFVRNFFSFDHRLL